MLEALQPSRWRVLLSSDTKLCIYVGMIWPLALISSLDKVCTKITNVDPKMHLFDWGFFSFSLFFSLQIQKNLIDLELLLFLSHL